MTEIRENAEQFVLNVACPNRPGIVHALTSVLIAHECDIAQHQQFDDHVHDMLFTRTAFGLATADADVLRTEIGVVADRFGMTWQLHDARRPVRALVMVSKFGHCLNDLLYRWTAGSLDADIVQVVSNHEDLRPMAERAGVPFTYVPVTKGSKPEAEERLKQIVIENDVDLVVLARYMQVLSDDLCTWMGGRAINIHHSFLPSFKGARPYHQAYLRGVKQIGATAHYVTPDLDEGPIIEQDVTRVDHSLSPDDLVATGRDVESLVLARAVQWHAQHRVLQYGSRTVVFK
ncbi:formyltetrahydrofolate deformylase [Leekyejoonella antrihumi]|uniref:Formyltetrahydrofolate deformylase n=1 Tax=Leekyejoonella antrihumi TaxID=1660198 RepID=A0A563E8S0_9MICO|nr:formyltetrahydrofolate deformylase [Leekyejoonella antrihumi]TWP38845.1 formyltetrahydrofolate deformylase [Leekyejoonella antrihumi]